MVNIIVPKAMPAIFSSILFMRDTLTRIRYGTCCVGTNGPNAKSGAQTAGPKTAGQNIRTLAELAMTTNDKAITQQRSNPKAFAAATCPLVSPKPLDSATCLVSLSWGFTLRSSVVTTKQLAPGLVSFSLGRVPRPAPHIPYRFRGIGFAFHTGTATAQLRYSCYGGGYSSISKHNLRWRSTEGGIKSWNKRRLITTLGNAWRT